MPDNQHYYGLRWVKSISGACQPKPIRCQIATGYRPTLTVSTTDYYVDLNVGDPVRLLDGGFIQIFEGAESDAQDPVIAANYGVVVGFEFLWDAAKAKMDPVLKYPSTGIAWGTNLERASRVLVVPTKDAIFEVGCDDKVTADTLAEYRALIGDNVAHIFDYVSGGWANPLLDISTHDATDATLPWRIWDVSDTRNNENYAGDYVKMLVTTNIGQFPEFKATLV